MAQSWTAPHDAAHDHPIPRGTGDGAAAVSDNRTGEERVMDAAWGRLEAPETRAAGFDPRKHEWRGNGWRHHVLSYGLTWRGDPYIQCSEANCEYNVGRSS